MQKMTMVEASVIVGGTCKTCSTTYELSLAGEITTCNEVKTCTDKYGTVSRTYTAADATYCGAVG